MKRLLDYDAAAGISTWYEFDHAANEFTIATEQSSSALQIILDGNKAQQNAPELKRQGIRNSWMKAATIPNGVIEKWLREERVNLFRREDWPKVQGLLNSPDYRYLKTIGGRV